MDAEMTVQAFPQEASSASVPCDVPESISGTHREDSACPQRAHGLVTETSKEILIPILPDNPLPPSGLHEEIHISSSEFKPATSFAT